MKVLFALVSLYGFAIQATAQRQGIEGKVEWLSGNQMPGPDRIATPAIGIRREICIYEAVSPHQAKADGVFFSDINSRLVKKVKSKANGAFRVKLPAGEYSLFVKENQGLFANRFDSQGRINCVTVKTGEFSQISILVDYDAAY
jgi:hypothetical protein